MANKASYEEVLEAWNTARLTSVDKAQFQEKWTAALERLGWTRQEFHQELDARQHRQYFGDSSQ